MCRQGFTHHLCEHGQIHTETCSEATDHPFYIPAACSQYTSQRIHKPSKCGLGGYYCSKTRDGPFLDHVHETFATANLSLTHNESELAKIRESSARFVESADLHQVPQLVRIQHPAYTRITEAHHQYTIRQRLWENIRNEALAIMNDAKQHYGVSTDNHIPRNNMQLSKTHLPPWALLQLNPSTTDELPPIAQPMERPPAGYIGIPIEPLPTTIEYLNAFPNYTQHQPNPEHRPQASQLAQRQPQIGSSVPIDEHQSQRPPWNLSSLQNTNQGLQAQARMSPNTQKSQGARKKRKTGNDNNTASHLTNKGHTGHAENRTASPEKSIEVRRSRRVRTKPVKYAESSGSSVHSPSVSPQILSDQFVPTLSSPIKMNSTPSMRVPNSPPPSSPQHALKESHRGVDRESYYNESFNHAPQSSAMMHNVSISAPTHLEPRHQVFDEQWQAQPSVHLGQLPVQCQEHHENAGLSGMNQHSEDMHYMQQNNSSDHLGNEVADDADIPSELDMRYYHSAINDHDANLASSMEANQAHELTPVNPSNHAEYDDYEDLRRSFTHTPQMDTPVEDTSGSTDPRKRKHAMVPSPLMPYAKRVQLHLPQDNLFHNSFHGGLERSTLRTVSSAIGNDSPGLSNEKRVVSAPILTPTRVLYPPDEGNLPTEEDWQDEHMDVENEIDGYGFPDMPNLMDNEAI